MEKHKNIYELKEEMIEDDLENLETADGKISDEVQEEPEEVKKEETKIEDLEYTDGKARDELDKVEEQEKIHGVDLISPFKTADIRIFKNRLETMDRDQMSTLAQRVAARVYSTEQEQKDELMKSFREWSSQNGFIQTDASKVIEKGVRADAFGDANSVNELEAKLNNQTMSDLQATAARLGFNPGFDRQKLIQVITKEFLSQS
jgi:hypothetical protein